MTDNKKEVDAGTKVVVIEKTFIQRIAEFKAEFHSLEIKMTGENTFSRFFYFQLKDFVDDATILLAKHGLYFKTNFPKIGPEETDRICVGVCHDAFSDKEESFELPVVKAFIKGANEIQALGATITYMRRYIWMVFLDLVESDAVDQNPKGDSEPEGEKKPNRRRAAKKTQDKTEPVPVKEKLPEEPSLTDNYRKHFMKELEKTENVLGAIATIEDTKSGWGKKVDTLSVTEMKEILRQMKTPFPTIEVM